MDNQVEGGYAVALSNFEKRWTGAWLEGWKSYWEIVADFAGNPGSFPQKAPAAYGKLLEANARYYKTVLDSGVELATRIYGDKPQPSVPVQDKPQIAAGSAVAAAPPSSAEKPLPEVFFEGVAGATPGARFLVANRTPGALNVSFELSDLISLDGLRMRLDAELSPASFSIQPDEERVVECRVPIDSSLVEGNEYRGILRAVGLPEMRMILCVKRLSGDSEA